MGRSRLLFFILLTTLLTAAQFCLAADADPAIIAATQLAHRLENAANAEDASAALKTFDVDALVDLSIQGIPSRSSFENTFREFYKSTFDLFNFVNEIGTTGSYHLLRVRRTDGQTRVLFRLMPKTGGFNYHEWVLGTDAQGRYKFVDLYMTLTGELLSQTNHRLLVTTATETDLLLSSQPLTQHDQDVLASSDELADIGTAVKNKNYRQVLADYHQLPESIRNDKTYMLVRFLAAYKLKKEMPQEYVSAVKDFRRLFPDDPCLNSIALDQYVLDHDYPSAHEAIAYLQKFTDGDPYLNYYEGVLDFDEGGDQNYAVAAKRFHEAIDAEPTLAKPYWGLVLVSMKQKDFDQTAALLTEMEQKLHIRMKNLETVPAYADFVKSAAYKKWKAGVSGAPASRPAASSTP